MTTDSGTAADLNDVVLRMERELDGVEWNRDAGNGGIDVFRMERELDGVEWNRDAGNGGIDVFPEAADDMGPGKYDECQKWRIRNIDTRYTLDLSKGKTPRRGSCYHSCCNSVPRIDTQHTDLHQLLLTKCNGPIRFSLPEALTRFLKAKLRVMQEEIDRLCQELTTKVTRQIFL